MLWWLLLLVMGHVVLLVCAVWFADFGVCGVVCSRGWWPSVWGKVLPDGGSTSKCGRGIFVSDVLIEILRTSHFRS